MGMPEDLKDIPEVKSVEVLHLNPGDSLVIKCRQPIREETRVRILEMFQKQWGGRFKDVPVIILDSGIEVEVLRNLRKS